MNREEGVVKGQVEEGEVKRSKPGAEESSESAPGNELNPFLVEPVLVKLLKLVEKVSQLKELRKMCQTWGEFNLKELEDRAFKGKVKPIDFLWWTDKFATQDESEEAFLQFMEDTQTIPRVFSSFKFNFPECWTIFQNQMKSIYPMTFLHLDIIFPENEECRALFTKFMESEIWRNLKEITISDRSFKEDYYQKFPYSPPLAHSSGIDQYKLQKLDIKASYPGVIEMFESAFASGKYTNLNSLRIMVLYGSLDLPGLDLTKLTRLEIGPLGDGRVLKFTSDLINLARNGMTLKNFDMSIYLLDDDYEDAGSFFNNLRLICSNLTQFLTSQSATLETLSYGFTIYTDYLEMPEEAGFWCIIHLPKFEALHKLYLNTFFYLSIGDSNNIINIRILVFGMTHNISFHFPKLVNLTLECEGSLIALSANLVLDEADGLQLERLEIIDSRSSPPIWTTSFVGVIGSVKELKCPRHLLYGESLPWAESLRSLYIHDKSFRPKARIVELFKLNHLKKLEKLIITYFAKENKLTHGGPFMKVEEYLSKWSTELPLKSITFTTYIGPEMTEATKEKFIKYFPFPVEFKTFR